MSLHWLREGLGGPTFCCDSIAAMGFRKVSDLSEYSISELIKSTVFF